ncbi:hypothetical protein B0T24DRAFT_593692 [Lasiosphaeria ovina]|uniref:Uncharacterized protein n=1 Tax=Lasiosphaeria ovina TaxID=92902 RepID=A0AAE0KBK7_9PEZI|nr:hypothetical protein B0T24DRAFT_593692 [Lasiosphaeria ovina]
MAKEYDFTKITVTPTLYHNKLKAGLLRKAQDDIIAFVPYLAACLASYISTRALSEDAFEAGYKSMDELLQRPILEHLKWRDEIKGRLLVAIDSRRFWEPWDRAIWVLGLRNDLRPFAAQLDASPSEKVHLKGYRPNFADANLMKIVFGEKAGETDALCELRRRVSRRRNEFALIDPTPEDLEAIGRRDDVLWLEGCKQKSRTIGNPLKRPSFSYFGQNIRHTIEGYIVKERLSRRQKVAEQQQQQQQSSQASNYVIGDDGAQRGCLMINLGTGQEGLFEAAKALGL